MDTSNINNSSPQLEGEHQYNKLTTTADRWSTAKLAVQQLTGTRTEKRLAKKEIKKRYGFMHAAIMVLCFGVLIATAYTQQQPSRYTKSHISLKEALKVDDAKTVITSDDIWAWVDTVVTGIGGKTVDHIEVNCAFESPNVQEVVISGQTYTLVDPEIQSDGCAPEKLNFVKSNGQVYLTGNHQLLSFGVFTERSVPQRPLDRATAAKYDIEVLDATVTPLNPVKDEKVIQMCNMTSGRRCVRKDAPDGDIGSTLGWTGYKSGGEYYFESDSFATIYSPTDESTVVYYPCYSYPADTPTAGPTVGSSSMPTNGASPTAPTAGPNPGATVQPSSASTAGPNPGATAQPSSAPTAGPNPGATAQPSSAPTAGPNPGATVQPSSAPTAGPNPGATAQPSSAPTAGPNPGATAQPSSAPTAGPNPGATAQPSSAPTAGPNPGATVQPSSAPTDAPSQAVATSPPPQMGPIPDQQISRHLAEEEIVEASCENMWITSGYDMRITCTTDRSVQQSARMAYVATYYGYRDLFGLFDGQFACGDFVQLSTDELDNYFVHGHRNLESHLSNEDSYGVFFSTSSQLEWIIESSLGLLNLQRNYFIDDNTRVFKVYMIARNLGREQLFYSFVSVVFYIDVDGLIRVDFDVTYVPMIQYYYGIDNYMWRVKEVFVFELLLVLLFTLFTMREVYQLCVKRLIPLAIEWKNRLQSPKVHDKASDAYKEAHEIPSRDIELAGGGGDRKAEVHPINESPADDGLTPMASEKRFHDKLDELGDEIVDALDDYVPDKDGMMDILDWM